MTVRDGLRRLGVWWRDRLERRRLAALGAVEAYRRARPWYRDDVGDGL